MAIIAPKESAYIVKIQIPGCWAPSIEYPIASSKEEAVKKVKVYAPSAEVNSVEEQEQV